MTSRDVFPDRIVDSRIVFTAIELYHRLRQKDGSGGEINTEHNSVQSPISQITAELREEPKQSGAVTSGAPSANRRLSPKFGMV